jgi:hypothetical protein
VVQQQQRRRRQQQQHNLILNANVKITNAIECSFSFCSQTIAD